MWNMADAAPPDASDLFRVDFTVLLILRGVWVAGVFGVEVLIASANAGPPGGMVDLDGDIDSTIYNRGWKWPMCSGNPLWEDQEEGAVQWGGMRSSYVDLAYQLSGINCGFVLERLSYKASGTWRFRVLCSRGEPTRTVQGLHWRYDWIPVHLAPLVSNEGSESITIPNNDLYRILRDGRREIWNDHNMMVWEGFIEPLGMVEDGQGLQIQEVLEGAENDDSETWGVHMMGITPRLVVLRRWKRKTR